MEYILSEPVELLGSDLYAVSGGAVTVGSFDLNGSLTATVTATVIQQACSVSTAT